MEMEIDNARQRRRVAEKDDEDMMDNADEQHDELEDEEDGEEELGDWRDHFVEEELLVTARVLDKFFQDPSLKRFARDVPAVREAIEAARRAIKPNKEDVRRRRRDRKKKAKQSDLRVLHMTGIRAIRKNRVEMNGGSKSIEPPPAAKPLIQSLSDSDLELADRSDAEQEGSGSAAGNEGAGTAAETVDESAEGKGHSKKRKIVATILDACFRKEIPGIGISQPEYTKLRFVRHCHICHSRFDQLHAFYDQLCPTCADFNWTKRHQTADLKGRVALVTGGRMKIGFQIALTLLRCGARVIVTTRFPKDSVLRYANEKDYSEWCDRLQIIGLDFRDIPSIHRFTDYLKSTLDRLDIIINNAAQTVRRPPVYYEYLLETEAKPLPQELSKVVSQTSNSIEYKPVQARREDSSSSSSSSFSSSLSNSSSSSSAPSSSSSSSAPPSSNSAGDHVADAALSSFSATVSKSAADNSAELPVVLLQNSHAAPSVILSQLAILPSDHNRDRTHFPEGMTDHYGQQLDLRKSNSWVQRLGEVSALEMIECHAINTFAPFILNSELKPLLLRGTGKENLEYETAKKAWQRGQDEEGVKLEDGYVQGPLDMSDRYVVNVSAMEGQFYRNSKTVYHPHTNMAKASLNMMTRTAALDYALSNIFMTSVDTGFIDLEKPVGEPLEQFRRAMFKKIYLF